MRKPFRLLEKECAVERIREHLAREGFNLVSADIPDTAYTDSTLVFSAESEQQLRITLEKSWFPDGEDWEDHWLRLCLDHTLILEIDIEQLLRRKLAKPLRQHVLDTVLDAVLDVTKS